LIFFHLQYGIEKRANSDDEEDEDEDDEEFGGGSGKKDEEQDPVTRKKRGLFHEPLHGFFSSPEAKAMAEQQLNNLKAQAGDKCVIQ